MQRDQLSQDLASLKIDRGAPPRSGVGRTIVLVLIVLAVLAGIGYFVVVPKVRSKLLTAEIRTGEVVLISPVQSQVELTATGYVVALVYAKVASKVPGRIAEIFVEEGQTIEKGARVARLEDVDFKTALATARARAAAARSRIAVARAGVSEIRVQIEREGPLVEKGVSARATLEDLKTRSDSAVAAVRAAEAEAAASDAETKALEVQLGSYEIITPISGTVVDKLVEVGEGVSPGFGTPGVIEVVDLASLVVEVDVPEGRLSQVAVDGPCEIVLDAYPSRRFRGAVKEIGRRVNRAKATVPVKIRFVDLAAVQAPPSVTSTADGSNAAGANTAGSNAPGSNAGGANAAGSNAPGSNAAASNAAGSNAGSPAGGSPAGGSPAGGSGADKGRVQILPEMAARVSFLTASLDPSTLDVPPKLVVPASAITRRAGGDVVFVYDDGDIRMTAVKVGPPVGSGRELETKLPAGTKVVLDPPADLADGQRVKEQKR